MGPLDAFWHVLNFFLPAVFIGPVAAAMAKLLWRRELAAASWQRMSWWAGGAAALALLGGLVLFTRDGKMATYAAMLAACALGLWWAGFRRPR